MEAEKKPVRVVILGQPYTLLARGDPREAEELARDLDQLMMSIAAKAPAADSTRIAVLACLHLGDRLRTLQADLQRLHQKTTDLAGLLDQALAE